MITKDMLALKDYIMDIISRDYDSSSDIIPENTEESTTPQSSEDREEE